MKLHEFLMRNKNTASINTVNGAIVITFDENINGQEISVYCEGFLAGGVFWCKSVSVTIDGFDNIDEIELPEYPETTIDDFINEWFSDELQGDE